MTFGSKELTVLQMASEASDAMIFLNNQEGDSKM